MSQAHLTKLFAVFGLILLIVVVNSWLATQGAKAILKIPLLHEERRATAFLALAIGSVMLIITALAGLLHAKRYGERWHARVPSVWLEGLSTQSTEGQLYQAAILLLFIGLPLASFFHFIGIVWEGHLCVLNAPEQPLPVSAAWLSGIPNATDQIRLVDSLTTVQQPNGVTRLCKGGIEVFPGWEFFLLALFIAGALVVSVSFLYAVMLTSASRSIALASDTAEDD
jgi:hypothetical protein